MKKILLFYANICVLTLLFFFFHYGISYGQTHQWVSGGGSSLSAPSGYNAKELVRDMITDDHGNLYVLTEIMASGSITIDTITFPIQTNANSIYRSKTALLSYSCNGHIRWGKIIEGTQDFRFSTIAYSNGNVYISGVADGTGADVRYFGPDSTMSGNYYSSWLIKYDTVGTFKWMRSQADNSIASFAPTGNWFCKLLMQDTLIHCIKSVLGSGAHLSSSVVSQRGIYDYTYTPQGNLLSVVKLPFTDSMLIVNIGVPSSIHSPSNTLYLSVTNMVSYQGSGVAAFDATRSLISYDTFTTTGVNYGGVASSFRSGNAQYTFGTYFGTNCTFKGQTYNYLFSTGRFGFVMKTDLNNNLIWKRQLNSTTNTDGGLTTWNGDLVNGKMVLTGFAKSIVIGSDTLLLPGTTGKIPIVIMDSSGSVQKMDFWYNNNPTGGVESGQAATCYNNNVYIGGTILDSIWGGSSGYRSHGGPSDFFIGKYGYVCNCTSPTSAFTHTTPNTSGLINFTFTGTTTGIDSIRWQFGDGGTSTQSNPAHTFAAGTYTTCVTVYNACGATQSCQSITISCPQPSAAFTYTITGTTINTTYTGSTPIDSVRWNFGSSLYATGNTASHNYNQTGPYTVCAIAYKACGRDTACQTIIISCPQPNASFSYTTVGNVVNTTYTGSTPVDSVRWNFGSGPYFIGNTASHNYNLAGTYTICVIAYKGCGSDTTCQPVTVTCPQPNAAFSYTTTGNTVNTTYNGGTPVDSVRWNFGSAPYATGNTASHTYTASGTYTVCVIAYKGCGTDTSCQQVVLTCPIPDAAFSYTISGKTVQFLYIGTRPVTTVQWAFGDGGFGTGTTFSHTYPNTGSFTACVTGTNSCGDSNSCKSIQIQGGVGINDPNITSSIKVYPNPAAQILVIENATPGSVMHIYDITGRHLRSVTITNNKEQIDISHLSQGIYTLRVTTGDQQASWRFVKE